LYTSPTSQQHITDIMYGNMDGPLVYTPNYFSQIPTMKYN